MRTSRAAALAFLLLFLPRAAALSAQGYSARGVASWYGSAFQGRKTANGEIFDRMKYTAAHRSLPFGTLLLVTLESTGKRVVVRINDRGPFVAGRVIDLSEAAAASIGLSSQGLGRVTLEEVRDLSPGPVGGTAAGTGGAVVAGRADPRPAPAAEETGPAAWCDIQVASFSRRENADNAAARLRAAGYDPAIRLVSDHYRVLLEGLPAERAEAERGRLDAMGFPRVMVTLRKIAKDR